MINVCVVQFKDKITSLNLQNELVTLFIRCGFELLNNINDVEWVLMDLCPWKIPKKINVKLGGFNTFHENYRLHWAFHIVTRYLNEELIKQGKADRIEVDDFKLNKTNESHTTYNKNNSFSFPYPVIEEYTDYGCNNRTALVEKGNNVFICKLFKPDRLHYLHNEIESRKYLDGIVNTAKIIEVGSNYLLMENLKSTKPIGYYINKFDCYPLVLVSDVFKKVNKIFENGLILLDFHPGNVLVNDNGDFFFIDFEYIAQKKDNDKLFESSPFVSLDKLLYDGPLEDIEYDKYWRKNIPVKPEKLFLSKSKLYILQFLLSIKNNTIFYKNKLLCKIKKSLYKK